MIEDQATLFEPVAAKPFGIDIIGPVGEFGYGLRDLRRDLALAKAAKDILVVIQGPGGSVFEGFAMFAELDLHPANISVEIRSLAASIHSVIAMAADPGKISIHRLGRLMMHESRAGMFGTKRDAAEIGELLADLDEGIASAYAKHFNWDETQISAAMEATTWLTAKQLKKAGVVAEIVAGPDAVNRLDLSTLDGLGVPEDVREMFDKSRAESKPEASLAGRVLEFMTNDKQIPPTPAPNDALLAVVAERLEQLRSNA